jgi:hypothetical protein
MDRFVIFQACQPFFALNPSSSSTAISKSPSSCALDAFAFSSRPLIDRTNQSRYESLFDCHLVRQLLRQVHKAARKRNELANLTYYHLMMAS